MVMPRRLRIHRKLPAGLTAQRVEVVSLLLVATRRHKIGVRSKRLGGQHPCRSRAKRIEPWQRLTSRLLCSTRIERSRCRRRTVDMVNNTGQVIQQAHETKKAQL